MRLRLRDNLPFIGITVVHQRKKIKGPNILVDTGSGGTILSADVLSKIGIAPQPEDTLHAIFGVGGSEVVFTRTVDELMVGTFSVRQFDFEVGGMDYGFNIQGILGMDFLTSVGARIDLAKLEIKFSNLRGFHG